MKQLAIPLSNQNTVAKWLVISSKPDAELTPPVSSGKQSDNKKKSSKKKNNKKKSSDKMP